MHYLFYIVLLSLATFYLSRFPGHNGDMPFYIALVIEKEQGSMEGVVRKDKRSSSTGTSLKRVSGSC